MTSSRISRLFVLVVSITSVASIGSATELLKGKGQWQSLSGESTRGDWAVMLQREGTQLKGTLTLTGSNVFQESAVRGSIDGSSIVLGVLQEGAKQASFSAQLKGEKISGEWDSPTAEDHGVWYGELSPQRGVSE